ncbi:MAG: PD40 domain-containing protein [Proteobacteria bacterium]|nr:PD40 domain-containing protein [Pseudomonadota bacterium]
MRLLRFSPLIFALAAFAPPPSPVEPWAPPRVSSPMFESHAAFDPLTGDLYFVRSGKDFQGWRILTSRCGPDGWTEPKDAPFAGDGVEADPWFTRDGRRLYFISTRSTDGVHRKDLDIWMVERGRDGAWGKPQRLPEPVNTTGQEWFPRLGPDGWLYFGSSRPGGLGKTDIWRARQDRKGAWTVENLGPNINSAGDEYEPLPSADGKTLLIEASDGYFESEHQKDGSWGPRRKLGPEINLNGSEIGALASPSGRSLLFARDSGEPNSGEFFVWRRGGKEAWPPACPRK